MSGIHTHIDFSFVSNLLAQAGQEILIPAFHQPNMTQHSKTDGSPVTETDLACQSFLQQRLKTAFPDIAFLGEEMSEAEQKACLLQGGRFWCVDPLDGTSNFTVPFPMFASSIALIEDGRPVWGCIHDPVRSESFTASHERGLQLNGAPVISPSTPADLRHATGFIDFKRLPANLAVGLVSKKIYHSQRNIGSCALEWAWLASGRAHFIIHGGEKIWDYAAGSLLAIAAGKQVSDFSGLNPFAESRLSSPIIAAATAELHDTLLQKIKAINT